MKVLFTPPKFQFLGDFTPPNLKVHRLDPQKALPCAERRVLSPHWSRSDVQKPKKRKKDTPDSDKLAIRPDHPSPYRSQSLHAGWVPVCSSIYQVLLKSVQWFWRCGWSKIALSHYFGHWLIQQINVKNFHGSLTTVVRAQNDTFKTANITFSILHVERYTRPYQQSHAKMKSKILKPC